MCRHLTFASMCIDPAKRRVLFKLAGANQEPIRSCYLQHSTMAWKLSWLEAQA